MLDAGETVPHRRPLRRMRCFFGAWTKYKNIPRLIEAFALVRRALPDARLTLAGPVMPDVDLASSAQAGDGQRGSAARLRRDGGLATLFGEHRLAMFTYETVNISGSVHMAYTFGRPVVATRVGSMTDVVEDGITGLLAPAEAEAFARALVEVLSDPEKADRMGEAALRHTRSGSSWSTVADKASAAYEHVLTR